MRYKRNIKLHKSFKTIFTRALLFSLVFLASGLALAQRYQARASAHADSLNDLIQMEYKLSKIEDMFIAVHSNMSQTSISNEIFPLCYLDSISVQRCNDAMKEMNNSLQNSSNIKIIILYLEEKNTILASNYMQSNLVQSSYGNMISAYLSDPSAGNEFEQNGKISSLFTYGENLIFVREFPNKGENHLAILFYYIDTDAFIREAGFGSDGEGLCLLDSYGNPIYNSDSSDTSYFSQFIQSAPAKRGYVELNGLNYKYCMSDNTALYIFLPAAPGQTLDAPVELLNYVLIFIVVTLLISVLMSMSIMQPVIGLNRALSKTSLLLDNGDLNEYASFADTYKALGEQNKALATMLNSVADDVTSRIMGELSSGRKCMNVAEISTALKSVNKKFLPSDYYEVICFDTVDETNIIGVSYNSFSDQLGEMMAQYCASPSIANYHIMKTLEKFMLVFSISGEANENTCNELLSGLMERLKELMRKQPGKNIRFGAGILYHSIFDLQFSFKEANDALKIKIEHMAPADFADEEIAFSDGAASPTKRAMQIVTLVLENNMRSALSLIDRTVNEIVPETESATACIRASDDWIATFINACASSGYVDAANMADSKEFHLSKHAVDSLDSTQIRDNALEITIKLAEKLSSKYHKQNNRYIVAAKDFIADNYDDPSLSQSIVADAIGTSASYLSRLFSDNMETSFSKYLNVVRVEISCELLKNTNKMVKDISDEVGFNSIQNFIRVFKGIEGVTPTQYRIDQKGSL